MDVCGILAFSQGVIPKLPLYDLEFWRLPVFLSQSLASLPNYFLLWLLHFLPLWIVLFSVYSTHRKKNIETIVHEVAN